MTRAVREASSSSNSSGSGDNGLRPAAHRPAAISSNLKLEMNSVKKHPDPVHPTVVNSTQSNTAQSTVGSSFSTALWSVSERVSID